MMPKPVASPPDPFIKLFLKVVVSLLEAIGDIPYLGTLRFGWASVLVVLDAVQMVLDLPFVDLKATVFKKGGEALPRRCWRYWTIDPSNEHPATPILTMKLPGR